MLTSDAPDGVLVLDIREAGGDVPAAFAYGFIKGAVNLSHARNREELLGAVLSVLPDIRDPAKIGSRLQQERTNYRNAVKSAIHRIDEADRERRAQFESLVRGGTRTATRTLWHSRDVWRRVQKSWQSQASQAVLEINAVQAAYLEAMHLQAPVKYWSDKAATHRHKELWGIARLTIFFPIALAVLGFAFWKSATHLLRHASTGASTPTPLYIIIGGGLVVFSTLLFWVGRLLTKLYLSEHHLRNDAEERAIMTQTYLALTKESAASDADRNIVLTAIFRNTPDGIVKDEGPADVSMQALLSRLLIK